jgi:hypothetical protein
VTSSHADLTVTSLLQVDPFLSVKTPRSEPVAFTGSLMYNEGRILKADVKFDLLDFKPTTASGMINHNMTLSFLCDHSR